MGKIREWFSKNILLISSVFSFIVGIIIFALGFKKGSDKKEKETTKREIEIVKEEAKIKIEKEKIADEKKTIKEISKDVDDMLDS